MGTEIVESYDNPVMSPWVESYDKPVVSPWVES